MRTWNVVDRDIPVPDVVLSRETAHELERLEEAVQKAWTAYREAQEAELERIRDEIVQQRTKDLCGE